MFIFNVLTADFAQESSMCAGVSMMHPRIETWRWHQTVRGNRRSTRRSQRFERTR